MFLRPLTTNHLFLMKLQFLSLLCVVLLYLACEKESAPVPKPPAPTNDFRDAFVGNYSGTTRTITRVHEVDSTWVMSDTTIASTVIVSYEIDDSLSYYVDPPSYHEMETFPAIRIDGILHAVDTSGDFRQQLLDGDYFLRGLFIEPDSFFHVRFSALDQYTTWDSIRAVRQ